MFFCCTFCQGLEPVSVVCYSKLSSPLLHSGSNLVCYRTVKWSSIVHRVNEFCEDCAWKIFEHLLAIEHIFCEIVARSFRRHFYCSCFFLKSRFYYSES